MEEDFMQKTVVFHTMTRPRADFLTVTDNTEYYFHFYVVDSSLVGEPEERSSASKRRIIVGITYELLTNWRLEQASEEDLTKVLFHYGRRYVEEKIKKGTLSEYEELLLSTREHREGYCPLDVSRIPDPIGFTSQIDIDDRVDLSLRGCFEDFADYIQSEMRMTFWQHDKASRRYKWVSHPEQRAKDLLRTFLNGRFGDSIYTFEEIRAGAGVIDVFIISPRGEKVVVELKMCGHGYSQTWAESGIQQLTHYMENKNTENGYLIVFDSRVRDFSQGFQPIRAANGKSVTTVVTDLRPHVKQEDVPGDV
jgi:hypothetical protein